MNCAHQHCGLPVHAAHALFSNERPYHVSCFYAHRDYKGADGINGPHASPGGSPFTTVTGPAGTTTGQSD